MKSLRKIFSISLVVMILLLPLGGIVLSASELDVLDLDDEIVLSPKKEEQMFKEGKLPNEYVVKDDNQRYGKYVKKVLRKTKYNYRTYAYVPGFSKNVKRSSFCWSSKKKSVTVTVSFGASYGAANANISLASGGGTAVDCQKVSSNLRNVGTDIKNYTNYTARLYDYKYYDSISHRYLYTLKKATLTKSGSLDYRAVRH